MNRFRKLALKAFTLPINLKKTYRLHRKVVIVAHPYRKKLYNYQDKKIMCEGRKIPVRIFKSDTPKGFKVLIFFHGGGWVTGNNKSYSRICANMANRTGYPVVSVDYRLAPEHPFPAGVNDCYAVAKEISTNGAFFGKKPDEVILIGDSAGGNLAAVVSLLARDRNEFFPSKQILLYPLVNNDHSENSPYASVRENGTGYLLTAKRICDYMDLYIKKEEERYNPYVAPLLAEDLSNQPDTLIITAEYDPLRDEGEAYGMRLLEHGNKVIIRRIPGALHGFLSLPKNSACVLYCYDIINRFLHEEIKYET